MPNKQLQQNVLDTFENPQIFISVDLDSWIHCRWASGADHSLWSTSEEGYKTVYGQAKPGDDFDVAIENTLSILDKHDLKITFFVLSEIAELYPDLLRRIDRLGHEVALHGKHHVDNSRYTPDEFREMIRESRGVLEDIIGKPVVGYRAANLILSSEQLSILNDEGFTYDSSVCPSRSFFGKFSEMTEAPSTPYYPARNNLAAEGNMEIVELPLGVFPIINLPSSTGVMTRVLGNWWAKLGALAMIRKKYALYYFHPYEIGPKVTPPISKFYVKLFLRNHGKAFEKQLNGLFKMMRTKGEFIRGCDLASSINSKSKASLQNKIAEGRERVAG